MCNWLNIGVKLSRTGVGNVCPAEFSSNPEQSLAVSISGYTVFIYFLQNQFGSTLFPH